MNRYVLIAGIICAEALGVSAQTQSKQVRRLEKQRTEMQKKIEDKSGVAAHTEAWCRGT